MKIAAIFGPDDVRITDAEHPRPDANDIVVKVAACGICGSDLTYASLGGIGGVMPMPLGHEFAGVIAAAGHSTGFAVGARVVVNPVVAPNLIGNGGTAGAFAPYVRVKNATAESVFVMPEGMTFAAGAVAEPFTVALHAINRARIPAGARAVVFGAGPIGLALVALLRHRGVRQVISVDLSDGRLARARALGADHTINPRYADVVAEIGRAHGTGAVYGMPVVNSEFFFEACGAKDIIRQIVDMAPLGGHLVLVALHFEPVALAIGGFLAKELSMTASMAYADEFPEVIRILSGGSIDLTPFISHRFEFAEFAAAFETAKDKDKAAKILITFPEAGLSADL